MPVITFWSNNEKTIGQTVAISAVATVMAMERNYKVLLLSADFNNGVLEECFGSQESNKEILKTLVTKPQINLESGINGLLKLADSNRVTPEVVHDYTKIVFKNRLEVLYSPMNIYEEKDEIKFMEQIKNIIFNASRYYDYVFVDLKKGLKYAQQLEILKTSDVIVVNMDQKIKTFESFLSLKHLKDMEYKIVWNICKCDSKSKYNPKNITRKILKKQAIYEVPYNTLLLDTTQEGNIAELFIRLKTLKTESKDVILLNKIENIVEGILLKYQETRTK